MHGRNSQYLPNSRPHMELHRWLQLVADRGFWEADTGECIVPFTDDEIRKEAAFRCWLRQLEITPRCPTRLPTERELEFYAAQWDEEFGCNLWWSWPVWSTCAVCDAKESVQCPGCTKLFAFARYSETYVSSATDHAYEDTADPSDSDGVFDDVSDAVSDDGAPAGECQSQREGEVRPDSEDSRGSGGQCTTPSALRPQNP